jgi:hypothetical protein
MNALLRRLFPWSRRSRRGDAAGGTAPGDAHDAAIVAAVAEAAALLEGRAADAYESRRLPIPYWAWVNALAHRPPSAFRSLATAYSLGRWTQATIEIADELDRVAPAQALAIQASVLQPAELDAHSQGADRADVLVRVVRRHVAQARRENLRGREHIGR